MLRKYVHVCLLNQELSLWGTLIRLLETSNWSLRGTTLSLTETSFPKKKKIFSHIISCGHSKRELKHIQLTIFVGIKASFFLKKEPAFKALQGKIDTSLHFPASILCFHEEMTSKQLFSKSSMSSQHVELRCIFKLSLLIGVPPVMSWFHLPIRPKKHFIPAPFSLC